MSKRKVILGYSGGLDTTFLVQYLQEKHNLDVVAVTVDIGQQEDLETIRQKALAQGCINAYVDEGTDAFTEMFLTHAIRANALYQGVYPLATALGRPYISYVLANVARKEGTNLICHGCTGKGNDQIRIELALRAMVPDVEILAPIRDESINREAAVEYLRDRGMDLAWLEEKVYSIDQNLWGRSVSAGPIEDPWMEPDESTYGWCRAPGKEQTERQYIELEFEKGVPVALEGQRTRLSSIIERLNDIGGAHGFGRIDHIEDRVVGLKSREVYEAPAALAIIKAHQALEGLTLTKVSRDFGELVSREFAELIYQGTWFSNHTSNLIAYLDASQRFVSGVVRLRFYRGRCDVVGLKSPCSLYDHGKITYGKSSTFDQSMAGAFVQIFGQANQIEMQRAGQVLPKMTAPRALQEAEALDATSDSQDPSLAQH